MTAIWPAGPPKLFAATDAQARIAVWRKLKSLGVAQIGDGLVALPLDPRTQEHFEWIAASVREAGGAAIVWVADPAVRRDGEQIAHSLRQERESEYRALIDEIRTADRPPDGRAVRRWRKEWRHIDRRDYFPADVREEARSVLSEIVGGPTTVPGRATSA